MHDALSRHLDQAAWPVGRRRRMVDGLRLLQELARGGAAPVTYKDFAELVQPGLAPLAAARVLSDIGEFCNAAGWPNVTCFVVSARTGECSPGCRQIGEEGPVVARERAWVSYGIRRDGPLVDSVADRPDPPRPMRRSVHPLRA
ncbi:hypothetical protein ACI79P_13860 [Blastococcus sp. SYSU DS0510]